MFIYTLESAHDLCSYFPFFNVLFFIAAAETTMELVHQQNMPYGKTTLYPSALKR